MIQPPEIFLVDNGSLRPEATLALRGLAEALAERCALPVHAVSLLHSHKVSAEQLGGRPARIVKRALQEGIAAGRRNFVIVPLFLGPSRAIVDYLPELIEELSADLPDLNVRIADSLAGNDPQRPDPRLAEILAQQVRQVCEVNALSDARVALVDHGTPAPAVNQLRNAVAQQLSELLSTQVLASSMERRDGPAYDFNEPLLERINRAPEFSDGNLVVAMFFLLPGKHAGAGGDVAQICQGLVADGHYDLIEQTPLLGAHPLLLDILSDRLVAAL